jgi:hypothetical protein
VPICGRAQSIDYFIYSANYMMEGCRYSIIYNGTIEPLRAAFCIGTVRAILYLAPGMGICPPPRGVTGDQAARVIVKYIDDYPEWLNQNFYGLAAQALRTVWPCQH